MTDHRVAFMTAGESPDLDQGRPPLDLEEASRRCVLRVDVGTADDLFPLNEDYGLCWWPAELTLSVGCNSCQARTVIPVCRPHGELVRQGSDLWRQSGCQYCPAAERADSYLEGIEPWQSGDPRFHSTSGMFQIPR